MFTTFKLSPVKCVDYVRLCTAITAFRIHRYRPYESMILFKIPAAREKYLAAPALLSNINVSPATYVLNSYLCTQLVFTEFIASVYM